MKNGFGRSIILHLKELIREQGVIPLPGCWYYNHNSKLTLESAGYNGVDFTVDEKPAMFPENVYERFGIEDPRIMAYAEVALEEVMKHLR